MTCLKKTYDHQNRDSRRDVIASVIASQRIEGVDFDEESLSDLNSFVEGAIGMDEVYARARARFIAPYNGSSFDI